MILIMKNWMKYKDLFWQLTYKEIKARYKQSLLGYAWAIIVPLLNLVVLSIIFSYVFKVPTGNIPYPIFLFVALVPWIFFSNSISVATSSISGNGSLITKVKLPRGILPIAAISSKLIDFLLTAFVLIIFLIAYKIQFQIYLLFLPLIFIIQLSLILGVSLILSATNVFFRDIENILGVFLTIWMYLTPIFYSTELIPDNLKTLFYLNPMTGIISSYRNVILYSSPPSTVEITYSALISLFIFILGYKYFQNRSKYFADVI